MTDRIGQQLGNYRLTRLLGQGGFAEVYQAEHTLLATTAAIKVLHTQVSQEGGVHFQQEARLLASLKHPHIVQVLDFGVDGQTPYLIMDYAPHGTLRTLHARGTLLSLPTVVSYVTQMAEALHYAHERRVVHRDVKPENMLVGEQGQILLSDFGIALIAQSSRYLSTQDEVIGAIAYMSPEQILGKPRPASDQYSLGIVLYEWLCGTRPFRGSFTELYNQHLFAPSPSLCDKVPTLSREVEQVVMTALAKEPKERFESVQALACALERASLGTQPTQNSFPAGISSPAQTLAPSPAITATALVSPAHQPADAALPSPAHANPPTVTPPALPDPLMPVNKPAVSRRTVLIGASVAVIVAGGTGLFASFYQGQTVSSQTLTPTPHVRLFFTYRGHSSYVRAVSWSPDGQRIVSGSYDNTAQVWNASNGSHIFTYKGHSGSVNAVTWSPDGQRIASGSYDNTVQVWNASDGSHIFTYKGHSNVVSAVAWSPDGKWIASGSYDNTVQVWNAASDGSHAFTYKQYGDLVLSVAWSPDGKWIASGSANREVQVWNVRDGSSASDYGGYSAAVSAVAWSPDGKWIASGSYDNTVQVWNDSLPDNAFIYKRHSNAVLSVAWSSDGQRIASSSGDKTVQVWNASDGSHAFTYQGHSNAVNAVAWSPDGKRIASGSDDKTVQVWQAV